MIGSRCQYAYYDVMINCILSLHHLEFRLNACEARWEAARAMFYENRINLVYKPLDTKLV